MSAQLIGAWATVLALALPFVIAIARAVVSNLEARLPANLQTVVQDVVQTVVRGIEQSKSNATGPEKKAAATTAIQEIFASLHLTVPASFIDLAIEAAVAELPKLLPATVAAPQTPGV